MIYTTTYDSPIGAFFLASDDIGLIGVWMDGQKYFADSIKTKSPISKETDILSQTKHWLDLYFSGKNPDFLPPLHPQTSSDFRKAVWKILLTIPYGHTMTYGEIARQLAKENGVSKMSAQAVGGAVGHNPISIIVPCHRVVGSNGSLTGYAGGIDKKIKLLPLEHTDMSHLFVPKASFSLQPEPE